MSVVIKEPHKVKVRKPHICQGCGKRIEVGAEATSSTFAEGGDIWTFYECDNCVSYRNTNCSICPDREYCIQQDYPIGLLKECEIARAG